MTLSDLQEINKDIITVREAKKLINNGVSVICNDGEVIDFDIDV